MAFRSWNATHLVAFNSDTSSKFLTAYEDFVDAQIIEASAEPSHQTFAPSSFRCDRRSWFRLRGVQPDVIRVPDKSLEFTAEIGTACHRMIQSNLIKMLGSDWVDVSQYVADTPAISHYDAIRSDDSYETTIEIQDPSVRFACDGIIRWNSQLYLLEIKSSEYSSWSDLLEPKSEHIDQVKFYSTLLHLDHVLMLYIDRQYGGLKCYELHMSPADIGDVESKIKFVIECVRTNIAPPALPREDKWCTPNYCPYYKKCQEYGR